MEEHQDIREKPLSERALLSIVLFCLLILGASGWHALRYLTSITPIIRSGGKSTTVETMADARKLAAATQAFQTHFKVDHIPSRLKLCKYRFQYDLSNPLDRDSFVWLSQMWPRLVWTRPHSESDTPIYLRINWDGTESGGPAEFALGKDASPPEIAAPVILQGDQCLVFVLGGIPLPGPAPSCDGFSTNPTNPAARTTERITPFYEFKSNRLVRLHGSAFYSYLDAFGQQPYAYFSSYGRRNGYNRYFVQLGDSDCSRLGVWPYARAPGDYINSDSFQIISAGADGKFGRGSVLPNGLTWDPKDTSRVDPAGRDDQANFHPLLLGVRAE